MKKQFYKQWSFWGIIVAILLATFWIINNNNSSGTQEFNADRSLNVYTREIGSGTRSAFAEIVGLEDENGDDAISLAATVQNTTNGIMQAVTTDAHAISYLSLGSLNDSVKSVSVNGVKPSVESIQAGDYQIAREFSVVYGQELSDVAQDFWNFMFSAQAQELVAEDGYVPVNPDAPEYVSSGTSGSVNVVGSTSVEPTMSRFAEAYTELNPNATIDITAPGSGAGITSAIDGNADIGMTSREPDSDEAAQLTETVPIAVDGIVIIVNNNNPLENLELEQVQGVFFEYYDTWNELLENEE